MSSVIALPLYAPPMKGAQTKLFFPGKTVMSRVPLLCLDNLFLRVLKDEKYNIKMLTESAGEDFFLILYMATFSLKWSSFLL